MKAGEQEGSDGAAFDGRDGLRAFEIGDGKGFFDFVFGECRIFGTGNGQEEPRAARGPMQTSDARGVVDGFDAHIDGNIAVSNIKTRECVGFPSEDGHAEGLEVFAGGCDVEDGFDACGDDDDGVSGEGGQIGGNVEGFGESAMDAADAARDEDGNGRAFAGPEACGNGGGAPSRACEDCGEVSEVDLGDARSVGDGFEFGGFESREETARMNGEGGGRGAGLAGEGFAEACHFKISRCGQAVGDNDGFEADHRRAALACGLDLGGIANGNGVGFNGWGLLGEMMGEEVV